MRQKGSLIVLSVLLVFGHCSEVPQRDTEVAVPVQEEVNDVPSSIVLEDGGVAEPILQGDQARGMSESTATEVIKRIYSECVQQGSIACVKPKVLSFLSAASRKDVIPITEDLVIERTSKAGLNDFEEPQWNGGEVRANEIFERIDLFLGSHELKMRVPKEIASSSALPYVPQFLLQGLPAEIRVPLVGPTSINNVGQERGIMKKVVMPFLLGLKFKATALVPLALALIALKTWKALTLGLLSLVLSAAMVIFKFTKPKVVNYEVYHYPAPAAAAVIEHPAPSYDHHGEGGWSRSFDTAQPLVYRAYYTN